MKGYNTRLVWIISAEIRYLLSEQKKFQNKSKNIHEVYQSVFFLCIMFCRTGPLSFVMFWVKFYPDDVQKVLFARTFGCVIASAS